MMYFTVLSTIANAIRNENITDVTLNCLISIYKCTTGTVLCGNRSQDKVKIILHGLPSVFHFACKPYATWNICKTVYFPVDIHKSTIPNDAAGTWNNKIAYANLMLICTNNIIIHSYFQNRSSGRLYKTYI